MDRIANTRAAAIAELADRLKAAFDPRVQRVLGDDWTNVPVVTEKDLREVLEAVFAEPLPPTDTTSGEVRTEAHLVVWAKCPTCKQHGAISLSLSPELRVTTAGSKLHLKGTSKPIAHLCGQTTVEPGAEDGQLAAFTDDEDDEDDEDEEDEEVIEDLAEPQPVNGKAAEPADGDPLVVDGEKYRFVARLADGTISLRRAMGSPRTRTIPAQDLDWDRIAGVWRASVTVAPAADDDLLPA